MSRRFALPVVVFVFLLHFLPFLMNGSNAYIRIHDNLEGEWVWLDLLLQQGKALDFSPHTVIDNVMNGQPRAAFPTGLSVNVLLIWLLGSYWGYLISYFLLHLLAFAGMYLLLRTHFLTEEKHHFLARGIALGYSLVPFYVQFGVAGLPLLLFCFLNILKNRTSLTDIACIMLFPFYSSMVWAGTSALVALAWLLAADYFQRKKLNLKFFTAMAALCIIYAAVNFQMLSLSFLSGKFISHRTNYNIFALQEMSLVKGMLNTIYPLLFAHYHSGTVVTIPVFLAAAMAVNYSGKDKTICWLMISILAVCLAYGFYAYAAYLLGDTFPLLISFKANRFIILLPLLLFLLLAVSLKRIYDTGVPKNAITIMVSCQLAIGFFSNDEWLHNVRSLLGFKIKPACKEFFAQHLFSEIEEYVALPKSSYRVASLGISPSVLQYNGFYTLDGLLPIYDLHHKKQFREIIAQELEKNSEVKNYFDAWGNRCYIFSSELGIADRNYIIGKNQRIVLNNFEINTAAFKKMGGKYLFSAVQINGADKTGLKLLRVFEDNTSWWRVFVYEAI